MWDVNKHIGIFETKNLGSQATCLAFSPDGQLLAVGLVNGVFLLLDSQIEKVNSGTYEESYKAPTLDVIMSPRESKSCILAIKFSNKGDLIAVSFDNSHKTPTVVAQPTQGVKMREVDNPDLSFVMIYQNKSTLKNSKLLLSKDPFVKIQKIFPPSSLFQLQPQLRSQIAILQIDFSENDLFIQMSAQKVLPDHIREIGGEDFIFVWDSTTNQIVQDVGKLLKQKWPKWSIAGTINARFQGNSISPGIEEEEVRLREIEKCRMSSSCRFSQLDHAVCGSDIGKLYLFRYSSLIVDRSQALDFRIDSLSKVDMALTRGYSAHTSMIQCTVIHEDKYIFTSSVSDQCIIQWKVEYEDQDWELDFNKFDTELNDPFNEVPQKQRFTCLSKEVWSQRLDISEINQSINQDEQEDPACELELETVIGRRAFDRRNNLKIDCQDKILYSAGSIIVSLSSNEDPGADTQVNQDFLRTEDQRLKAISPEISTFALSDDRRTLVIGTSEIEANLIVWEISTNMQLARMILPNCSIILYLKIAHDNKHIIIIGLTKDFLQVIMIMDFTTATLIAQKQILHSLPYKIKDVIFYPNSTRMFITCGIQHMCFWSLNGNNIEGRIGELSIPRTFTNLGGGMFSHDEVNQGKFGLALVSDEIDLTQKVQVQEDELENIYASFLSIGFLKQTLVAGGDDGFVSFLHTKTRLKLYLWEHERIVSRIYSHESSILCIDTNPKAGLVVSGGLEGKVILWRLLQGILKTLYHQSRASNLHQIS